VIKSRAMRWVGPEQTLLTGNAYTIIIRNCEEEKMDWKAQGWIGD